MLSYITALTYLNQGISTIPLGYRSKHPDTHTIGGGWKKYQTKLPTKDELKKWFRLPYRNIAIVTGWQNLVIIDFDDLALYGVWASLYPTLNKTYKVKTRRGYHCYFYINNPPETGLKFKGIDVKAAGGYCLMPPSVHPAGHVYTPIQGLIITVDHLSDILPKSIINSAPRINPNAFKIPTNSPFYQYGNSPRDRIKANVKIIDYFPNSRCTSGNGRWFTVKCPLHDDKHASGWVDVSRNRYGCQTCFNGSMDIIEFYAKLKGVSNTEAIKELS